MRFHRASLFLLLNSLLLASCGHSLSGIDGFDAAAWRHDAFACQDQRRAQLPALEKGRSSLYGTRTNDVEALLGRPDQVELSAQTEKVYSYYVVPGGQCAAGHPAVPTARLTLRFDPLGRVSEVLIPVVPAK